MAPLAAIFVLMFQAVIAAVAAYAAGRLWSADAGTSIAVGTAVMLGLYLFQANLQRLRDRRRIDMRAQDLSTLENSVARTVQALAGRMSAAETLLAEQEKARREALDEVQALSAVVARLTESMAGLEARVEQQAVAPAAPPPAPPRAAASPFPPRSFPADLARLLDQVTSALDAGRIEVHLQPIVMLPQRRARYYEAFARLRTQGAELLFPADFIPAIAGEGLLPRIDREVVGRAADVLRKLAARQPDLRLFCNVSQESLNDGPFFAGLVDLVKSDKAVATGIILELTQAAIHASGPVEEATLGGLADLGLRFSVDRVGDLRADFHGLARRGFRFAKVSADLLLGRPGRHTGDIAPSDLSDMLARFGIDLIADRIETEPQVVDLLDFDVKLGQGYLFGAPRPVKADLPAPPVSIVGEVPPIRRAAT